MRYPYDAVSGQEVELKLEIAPDAAEALIASGLLPGRPSVVPLRSVYFDTPEHDLSAAGFSLRIRQAGDRRIQTVKAAGTAAAGLFARPEWERGVEGDAPVLDDATPVKAFLGGKVHDIGPAFAVEVERRIWIVSSPDATIEVALDSGEVVAGERRTRVHEIELELKDGAPAALFALARRIDSVAPARVGVLNKAERGFLLLGPAMRAFKAEPVLLAADMSAADAFRHIAGVCLRQFRLNEALIGRDNAEALHQARVALRRLRCAFSIFEPMLRDDSVERLRAELRWLAGALGDARDFDVLGGRAAVETVRARLETVRHRAYDAAETALSSPRARALMLDLSQWLVLGGWLAQASAETARGQPASDFAVATLERLRKKVKKGGTDLADLGDEARHELRKDAKKLRYAAEFFASLFQGKRHKRRLGPFLAALESLQDRLGALNDLASAPDLLARTGLRDDPAAAALLDEGKGRQALVEAAAEAHDAFVDTRRFWR